MKNWLIKILKYLLFLSIGLLLIYLIVKDLNFDSILTHFKKANYYWALLAIPIGIFSHVFRSARWNLLINELGYKPNLSTTFYTVMIGYLANTAVPRLGEITRCGVLSKKKTIPFDSLFGTVIAERTFDTFCLLIIILATIGFQLNLLGDFLQQSFIQPLSQKVSSTTLLIFTVVSFILITIAVFLVKKIFKNKNNKWIRKIHNLYLGIKSGFTTILKLKNKAIFIVYTIAIWILYICMVYVCFFALEETSHLTFIDALTIMALGSIGIVAPVPGGIGTYHAVVIFVLTKVFIIEIEPATTFAFIAHTSQLVMIILVGFISFLMIFRSNPQKN